MTNDHDFWYNNLDSQERDFRDLGAPKQNVKNGGYQGGSDILINYRADTPKADKLPPINNANDPYTRLNQSYDNK